MKTVLTCCMWRTCRFEKIEYQTAINSSLSLSSASVSSVSQKNSGLIRWHILWPDLCTRWAFIVVFHLLMILFHSESVTFLLEKNEPTLVTCITSWPARSFFFSSSITIPIHWCLLVSIGILFFDLCEFCFKIDHLVFVLLGSGRKLMTTTNVSGRQSKIWVQMLTRTTRWSFLFPCSYLDWRTNVIMLSLPQFLLVVWLYFYDQWFQGERLPLSFCPHDARYNLYKHMSDMNEG